MAQIPGALAGYVVNKNAFTFALPVVAITIVSYICFRNNPIGHSRAFRYRSFLNGLPLGLTYACLYMGRYDLTAGKMAFGDALMSKEDFGTILAVGAVVYGLSFIINGPITDRIGGKVTIIISAARTACTSRVASGTRFSTPGAAAGTYGLARTQRV